MQVAFKNANQMQWYKLYNICMLLYFSSENIPDFGEFIYF